MGLGNDFKEFENDATGQGGNDGDNNANNANGSNDKTEDTMVDSGQYPRGAHDSPLAEDRIPTTHTRASAYHPCLAGLDQFASKEGLPAGLDPEINNVVNDEINKF